ncbi:hypothetical protein J19TS2_06970 [Cohnella xylanilytica]|uniref:Uncharacterized protein n=1 Tax=Cohnella xylanilytica TaxID=557555 RepID=A0A841TWL1_9BACL|nr:hypothetical protein [Cohnella xylanilytica]MBB6691999.1 hypothetical protein [Cohnella xylanilytica]GIO11142.1 hypothetical protein J19TS2_06970 [Cohnella xylanilytica]
MTPANDQPTKAEVQSTKLNQMPAPGEDDTEFSAEEAAEVFENEQGQGRTNQSER